MMMVMGIMMVGVMFSGDGDYYSDYDDYHVDEDFDGTLGGMCKPPRALDVVEV